MSSENGKFRGFDCPKQNWFKIPNNFLDITSCVSSLSELRVVLYVMRHTWGYREQEDKWRRITLDEFENGRKRKDGSRVDSGVNMSKNAIRDGLKRAIEHGFIEVLVDDSDPARIRRYFRIKMSNPDEEDDSEGMISSLDDLYNLEDDTLESPTVVGVNCACPKGLSRDALIDIGSCEVVKDGGLNPKVDTLGCQGLNIDQRKTTYRKKTSERKPPPGEGESPKAIPHTPQEFSDEDEQWINKCAREAMELYIKYDIDIIHPPKRLSIRKLEENFRILLRRGESKEDVERILQWLNVDSNYMDEYTPKLYRGLSISENFTRYKDAIKRKEREAGRNGDKSTIGFITDEEARRASPSDEVNWRRLSPEQKARKKLVSIIEGKAVREARNRLRDEDRTFDSSDVRQVDLDKVLDSMNLPRDFTDLREIRMVGAAGLLL